MELVANVHNSGLITRQMSSCQVEQAARRLDGTVVRRKHHHVHQGVDLCAFELLYEDSTARPHVGDNTESMRITKPMQHLCMEGRDCPHLMHCERLSQQIEFTVGQIPCFLQDVDMLPHFREGVVMVGASGQGQHATEQGIQCLAHGRGRQHTPTQARIRAAHVLVKPIAPKHERIAHVEQNNIEAVNEPSRHSVIVRKHLRMIKLVPRTSMPRRTMEGTQVA